uniref:ZAD domain-containing protein n=1 Tax=Anopheles triannulatus TaxID=58253 RepID=A0A2M4AJU9_9DIPT
MDELSSRRCRLCLLSQFMLVPMFPPKEPVNDGLLKKILECTSLEISYEHDHSSHICIKCIVDVEQFYSFRERCRQSDRLLRRTRQDPAFKDDEAMVVDLEDNDELSMLTMELTETCFEPTALLQLESFVGPTKLVHIGYNYRVVRVNDEREVLIHRRHRYYRLNEQTPEHCNQWTCVARGRTGCMAALTITGTAQYPVALFTSRAVKHNHTASMVQNIGSRDGQSTVEQTIQVLPNYTFLTDCQQRLRLLAYGYRYRLRRALFNDGLSLWVCEQDKSGGCEARVMLSYENERELLEYDQAHNHPPVKDSTRRSPNTQNALMAQRKPKDGANLRHGYNFTIVDGYLIFGRNCYRASKPSLATLWRCTGPTCSGELRVKRKVAKLANKQHNHPPALQHANKHSEPKLMQQGINYRLVTDGIGTVWLVYRKQKFVFRSSLKNGTTEWNCIWRRLGCQAVLQMVPDEQIVYAISSNNHRHRIRNALEKHFPAESGRTEPERTLLSLEEYELRWNVRSRPIICRKGERFYARKAFTNGTVTWKCTRSTVTNCKASITIDKSGAIAEKCDEHDHTPQRSPKDRPTANGKMLNASDLVASPGPVRLLAGGFNYRRIHDVHLGLEIIIFAGHMFYREHNTPEGSEGSNWYFCLPQNEPDPCPAKITLIHNGLLAEQSGYHSHTEPLVTGTVQPDRTEQVTISGANYDLIFTMAKCNSIIRHDGATYRIHKVLASQNCSRWRCIHSDAGCQAELTVPLSLETPAFGNGTPHAHTANVTGESRKLSGVSKEEGLVEDRSQAEMVPSAPLFDWGQERVGKDESKAIDPHASTPLFDWAQERVVKDESISKAIDPNAIVTFQNGQLYVRNACMDGTDASPWICAFHWALNCTARFDEDEGSAWSHNHGRFAAVSSPERFGMLKTLITQGFIPQRGPMLLMPGASTFSQYQLLPSSVHRQSQRNVTLIIDDNRYNFYKAKNNGEWLWRCVRHRWQGCKIGVAVSHCFGKYHFQPYGTANHNHT